MRLGEEVYSQTPWTKVGWGGVNGSLLMATRPKMVSGTYRRVLMLYVRQAFVGPLDLEDGDICMGPSRTSDAVM